MDQDGDGQLGAPEIVQLLKMMGRADPEVQVEAVMRELDADGSGDIDLGEFEDWYKQQPDGKVKASEIKAPVRIESVGAYAGKRGLRPGMRILSIQSEDAREMTLRQVTQVLDRAGRPLAMEFDPSISWRRQAQQQQQQNASGNQQMSKPQVRARVRAHLAKHRDQREASDAWIDARFSRFDADRSGTVDESEWENLLKSLEPVVVTMTLPPPWGVGMETNHNSALAVTEVQKRSPADTAGLEPGMVLTSVNGVRVKDAATGKKLAVGSGVPVKLGFDEPEPKKQLSRVQCREMVRIQLELDGRDPNVSDDWIDSLFDEFDADRSGLIDDDEWDNLASQLASCPYPAPEPEPPTPQLTPMLSEPPLERGESEPEDAGHAAVHSTVDSLPVVAEEMQVQKVDTPVQKEALPKLEVDVDERREDSAILDLNTVERGFVPSQVNPGLFERGPYKCTLQVGQTAKLVSRTDYVTTAAGEEKLETDPSYCAPYIEVGGSTAVTYSGKECTPPNLASGVCWAHSFSAVATGSARFAAAGVSDTVCITVVAKTDADSECVLEPEPESEPKAKPDFSDPKIVPQTPPVNRPGRSSSQNERQHARAMELREGRNAREGSARPDPNGSSRWSLPVGVLVAARATEATLHAAAATGRPVGRPDGPSDEILVPAVLPPPSIACNIRRRSLGAKASPPVQRSPVSTKKTGDSSSKMGSISLEKAGPQSTGAHDDSEVANTEGEISSRERSPSAIASDGSLFVARGLAEVKAAQLRMEGDSAAQQGDVQIAREKYSVAAKLVEASSPLGVELRRQLASETPDGESKASTQRSGGAINGAVESHCNIAGSAIRRTPRRLNSPRAAAAAGISNQSTGPLRSTPWLGTDGGTPRRPEATVSPLSSSGSPSAVSPETPVVSNVTSPDTAEPGASTTVSPQIRHGTRQVEVETQVEAKAQLTAQATDAEATARGQAEAEAGAGAEMDDVQQAVSPPATAVTSSSPDASAYTAADTAALIACDAAAAACDAAAAAAAAQRDRVEAFEERQSPEPVRQVVSKRQDGSPLLGVDALSTAEVDLNSPRQLRQAEEELEGRISALQRYVGAAVNFIAFAQQSTRYHVQHSAVTFAALRPTHSSHVHQWHLR